MQMHDNQNSIRTTVFPRLSWLESTCRGLIPRRHENLFVSGEGLRGKKRFSPLAILSLSSEQEKRETCEDFGFIRIHFFPRWKNASHTTLLAKRARIP